MGCNSGFKGVKLQLINLRIFCIWLVDSVECSMMMHGLANTKSRKYIFKKAKERKRNGADFQPGSRDCN
jgi:hypothetical protein